MSRDWNASGYHRVSGPMVQMAAEVLDRLPLRGDETVLDAGCGTGRVTRLLVERLPRGRVIAVDASPAMAEAARRNLGPRAEVIEADLTALELPEPVDAVFSTATFHWVLDHDRLFRRLFDLLRPGGRLVAQCGGEGNISSILEAAAAVAGRPRFAPFFAGWERPSHFPSAAETRARLERAGFSEVRCRLQPRPVVPEEPLEYLRTVTLGPHLQQLPDEELDRFLEEVVGRLPRPVTIDYVRLDILARRPPT